MYISKLSAILAVLITVHDCGSRVRAQIDTSLISSDWQSFYSNFCGRFCVNGTVRNIEGCANKICFPCECDKNCVLRGTCCEHFYVNESFVSMYDNWNKSYGDDLEDIVYRVRCKTVPLSFHTEPDSYLIVSTCPSLWKDSTTRLKCEQPTGDSLESVTHYQDFVTGLMFQNIHCVVCNGLESYLDTTNQSRIDLDTDQPRELKRLRALKFRASCDSYNRFSHITDQLEFYKTVASSPHCIVYIFEPMELGKCPGMFGYTEVAIKESCPKSSNKILQDLCHNLPPVPALSVIGAKNIFCHLCQTNERFNIEDYCRHGEPMLPHKLLFKPSPRLQEKEKLKICEFNRWNITEGHCLRISCTPGKVAINEDTCETPLDDIWGLDYSFTMVLISKTPIPTHLQGAFIKDLISKGTLLYVMPALVFSVRQSTCRSGHNLMNYQLVQGSIEASGFESRDEFENVMVRAIFRKHWNVLVMNDDGTTHNVSLSTVCVGKQLCEIYQQKTKQSSCSVSEKIIKLGQDTMWTSILELSPILTCPYVTFDLTRKPTVVDGKLKVYLDLNGLKGRVTWDPSGMFYNDSKIYICVHVYRHIENLLEKDDSTSHTQEVISIVHYYLDIICIFVSCTLLLVSIVTYLTFPSLRSLPGLNTMCLCLCLLTAQSSLLITTLFGTRGLLTESYCMVHGIVLHYSWVASFVWMNTCCIHMYRVFTGFKMHHKLRNFIWYCLYSFGFPTLVVSLVIVTTTLTTGGKSMGYDRHICFLDTATSSFILVMGLLAPLAISVITNGVLFLLTIKKMVSMTRLRLQPKSNHGVVTYVKLSTVTGVFCLLAATAIQLDNPVLSLIASPFAALQGVFIFVSFIANKRVFKLYVQLISRTKITLPSSKTKSDANTTDEKLAKF